MNADNIRSLAGVITVLAWIVIGLALTGALSYGTWLITYTQQLDAFWMLGLLGITASLHTLAYLVSAIVVLVWIYRAHANLHRAGVAGLKFSPGWAAACYFVPVANLFVPFQAMRELVNRSAGEPVELAEASVEEVFSWWGMFLGAALMNTVIFVTTFIDDVLPGIYMTTPFWADAVISIFALILSAGSAFFLIQIVRMVTRSQAEGGSVVSTFE